MELNTQIWGDSSTWSQCREFQYNDSEKYHVSIGKYKRIYEYQQNDPDNFQFNTPWDKSFVYNGHAAGVSPFGDRAVFYYNNENIETTSNVDPFIVINDTISVGFATTSVAYPTNIATYDNMQTHVAIDGHAVSAITGLIDIEDESNNSLNTRWQPNAGNYESDSQLWWNYCLTIKPIVDFSPYAFYGVIMVQIKNPNNGDTALVTLYEAVNNSAYVDYKILKAYMEIKRPAGSGETPNFENITNQYNYEPFGAISLDTIDVYGHEFINYCDQLPSTTPQLMLFGFINLSILSGNNLGVTWVNNHNTRSAGDPRDYTNYYSYAPIFYGYSLATFENVSTLNRNNDTVITLKFYLDISNDTYETLMKYAACYGIFFTDGKTDLRQVQNRWTHEDMCLGLLHEGVGYGDYTRGAGNTDNPAYSWTSSHQSGYDPSKNVDPNTYSDTTNFNTLSLKQAFTRRYALTSNEVQMLAGKLWDANATKDPDITMNEFTLDEYLTNNPIDCIVSLKYFPCKFFTDSVLPLTPLYLGKYNTNMLVYGVDKEVRVIDFAPIMVFRHFGDFRDFEPYTQLQMYIPFCGTVSIPCAEAMGKYVAVKLVIDVSTGAASGFVLVSNSGTGGICVATATGTAAIDLPVSGLQSANLSQAIFNATANWTQTQISNGKIGGGLLAQSDSFIGTMARGYSKSLGSGVANSAVSLSHGNLSAGVGILSALDPAKAIETGLKTDLENARAKYDLTHVEMPMRLIGSASPMLSAVLETVCRLIIYRPRTDENALASYADTVGYACCKSGVVSNFSGFTVGTIDVSGINATQEEKAAIAAAFASGVYL